MQNVFKITLSTFWEKVIEGAIIAFATFLVGFFGDLNSVDFFANLDWLVISEAFIAGINKMWQLFYAAVVPLFVALARWDKK